jgi:hypothetical protein
MGRDLIDVVNPALFSLSAAMALNTLKTAFRGIRGLHGAPSVWQAMATAASLARLRWTMSDQASAGKHPPHPGIGIVGDYLDDGSPLAVEI